METVNIFEVIGKTTSQIEPFHSRFLAEALQVSAKGNRSLFDAVWKLAAPDDWAVPLKPEINSEELLEGGKRIDICILDKARNRLLGIEVKTTKASAQGGQLESYLEGLCKKYDCDRNDRDRIAIAYLTPFNSRRAGDNADSLPTVKLFHEFSRNFANARHISWLDIAEIPWDGNALWRQHQAFVYQEISNYGSLNSFVSRNRGFDDFFSEAAVEAFWSILPVEGDRTSTAGVTIDVESIYRNDPRLLVEAFKVLIRDEENVSESVSKSDDFSDEAKQRFLESKYGEIHSALFSLSSHSHVWLAGKQDYGLRVAHKRHRSSGVSLVRSKGTRHLLIGQSR